MADKNNKNGKNKVTSKQVLAIAGIVLLLLLYIITFFVAIFDTSSSGRYFGICISASIAVPLLLWIYIWIYEKLKQKSDFDPSAGTYEDASEDNDQ